MVVILQALGFKTYQNIEDRNMQLVGIDGAHPVWIGAPCNALTLLCFLPCLLSRFRETGKQNCGLCRWAYLLFM